MMETHFIEATNPSHFNYGKFMLARFSLEEWQRRAELPGALPISLLAGRGWGFEHLLFLDLQTGEGAILCPKRHGSVKHDLEKHAIWICPMAEPFLEWLYQQDVSDFSKLPRFIELDPSSNAHCSFQGYRRPGHDRAAEAAGAAPGEGS